MITFNQKLFIWSADLTDMDGDWRAPHQNSVTHVDPHAPLAGLPPGEGNSEHLPALISLN